MVDLNNAEFYLNGADAYQAVTKIRTTEGLRYDNSGQYINLEDLNKVDKENLKNALNTIKELEELIKDNFQLTQFS
jgi:CBS domain-containing protein